MHPFQYVAPANLADASAKLGEDAKLLAGGIDLLGEMKDGIATPARVVNLKSVKGLKEITFNAQGLTIGALVTLAEIAGSPRIRKEYRGLAQAAEAVATPQIRNVGTVGGNLCQRPRCWYYRDPDTHCLKKGGAKCFAVEGDNRFHNVLGGGPCHIVHPSDVAPALVAMNASVTIFNGRSERTTPIERFFELPVSNLYGENVLQPNEIVTAIRISPAAGPNSTYVKYRERESFDWALVSAAIVLKLSGGIVKEAKVALGGVAQVPWRSVAAESHLVGKAVTDDSALAAGKAAVQGAVAMTHNAYKIPLAVNCVREAVLLAAK